MVEEKRWKQVGWKTQKAARATFRRLVAEAVDKGYRPGDPFQQLPGAALFEGLTWLVDGHPQLRAEMRGDIWYFALHTNRNGRKYGAFGFSVFDRSGREHVFSVDTALKGKARSPEFRLADALRGEVLDQQQAARDRIVFGRACPETGVTLTYENSEVDHAGAGFAELVRQFLLSERLTVATVEIGAATDTRLRSELKDRALAWRWQQFHRQYAVLEAVSVEGHKIRTKRRGEEEDDGE